MIGGKYRKQRRRGSVTARRKCGEGGSMELLSVLSVLRMNKQLPLYAVGGDSFYFVAFVIYIAALSVTETTYRRLVG
jgi:hypothetical protein